MRLIIHAFPFLDVSSFTLMQNYMRKAPTFLFHNEWVLLALTVRKSCQPSKSTNGFQRYGKKNISTQITSEVECFWLKLSKKVKCHLFCINLYTGYLLYVVLWIPKAFSLLTHHPRVVFTISKKEFPETDTKMYSFLLCKIWIFFKIKNIYIDSDFSTSNSQVYHYFEKKDY